MLVHRRVIPSIKFAGTHLYTWVERGTVRIKCLSHEHNAMFPGRSQTRSTQSRVECTNHEATAPPTYFGCTSAHFHILGRHLGFSNFGGLGRGYIAEGVGVKWKNGQGGHISGRVVMHY